MSTLFLESLERSKGLYFVIFCLSELLQPGVVCFMNHMHWRYWHDNSCFFNLCCLEHSYILSCITKQITVSVQGSYHLFLFGCRVGEEFYPNYRFMHLLFEVEVSKPQSFFGHLSGSCPCCFLMPDVYVAVFL